MWLLLEYYIDGGNSVAVEFELFNTSGNSWCRLTILPYPLPQPCAAICGDQVDLYVVGCGTDGYCCSLSSLLYMSSCNLVLIHCIAHHCGHPYPVSTAVMLGGLLVICGG